MESSLFFFVTTETLGQWKEQQLLPGWGLPGKDKLNSLLNSIQKEKQALIKQKEEGCFSQKSRDCKCEGVVEETVNVYLQTMVWSQMLETEQEGFEQAHPYLDRAPHHANEQNQNLYSARCSGELQNI